ncbi:hypothetical protein SAMN05428985_108154 [Nocardioides sp. YR527]|nr:hypothetical protein SAMN05428985_108154 [Nocardioides sp. YR527]
MMSKTSPFVPPTSQIPTTVPDLAGSATYGSVGYERKGPLIS